MKYRIRKQARKWILRFTPDQPALTTDEIERFALWMKQHLTVFLAELAKHPDFDQVNIKEVRSLLRKEGVFFPATVVPVRPRTWIQWWVENMMKIAIGTALASILITVLLALGIKVRTQPTDVLTTEVGEQRSFVLSDHSAVVLNTNSRLLVDFTGHKRHLKLVQGEARFTVARDPERPVLEETQDAAITDIGTTFNVFVSEQGTNVSVMHGRVLLSQAGSPENSLTLDAGEQGEVTPNGELVRGSSRPLARAKAWPQHRLVFIGEPAGEVVKELNRYYKQPIRIVDNQLARERLTLVFPFGTVSDLKEALNRDPKVEVTTANDGTLELHWQH